MGAGVGMIDEHTRLEAYLRDLAAKSPGLFPHMTQPQPDKTERKRLEMQTIPFALPEKRND